MENLIQAAREQAERLTQAAYGRAAAQGLLPAGRAVPGRAELCGDGADGGFASAIALAGAASWGMAPRDAAGILAGQMELDGSFFERVEAAGPGFLNFFCAPRWYGAALSAARGNAPGFGPPRRPLPAAPAPLETVRRRAWKDAWANLLRRTGAQAPPIPAEAGPVRLLLEGRPAPGAPWRAAGEDALRFFLTARPLGRPVELDVDLAARQDGGNPLYRIQYACARVRGVLDGPAAPDIDPALLSAPEERGLVKVLARYPEELELAARTDGPSRVNHYLVRLAEGFWRFYRACPIRAEGAGPRRARMALAEGAGRTLADGLGLLGAQKGWEKFSSGGCNPRRDVVK